jgi:oxygen-independent coproporphyrinogen-3 oxidase
VHVPFCRRLCGYCDFYSVKLDAAAAGPLVDILQRELATHADRHALAFETIFVGGGTPTVLPPELLRALLSHLAQHAAPAREIEFTVEANPATVTSEVARILSAAGVNRVSIGAQSFHATELAVLDRQHHPPQVAETVTACRQSGMKQISLDLIFAIPGQTLDSWRASLDAALSLAPDHLSCYSLTFEPGTRLREQPLAGAVVEVDPDLDADMYELAIDTLTSAGYEHYEVSNFARPSCRCRHNLACWHNEPYLGIGPAAAGLVDGVRYRNVADVEAYVAAIRESRSPWEAQERLTPAERARETAMLELRLTEGIDRTHFAQRYGSDPVSFFREPVQRHATRGLLEVTETHLRLTRPGLLLADVVIADFL